MTTTQQQLDRMIPRLSGKDFLENKGLVNEVGIHVFCYDPSEEMMVTKYIQKLQTEKELPFRIIEKDLYKIFLQICEEKRVLKAIPSMEERKGKDYTLTQLQNIATPEAFAEKINDQRYQTGDVLLLTGLGKVYPFMRSHKILDNIQHIFAHIPIVMMYPGTFDGKSLGLFGKFLDGHYYRAFNLL